MKKYQIYIFYNITFGLKDKIKNENITKKPDVEKGINEIYRKNEKYAENKIKNR